MAKIIIMRGLPASGKSTRAQEILKESGNYVRINKDLLRTMLHFGKWTGVNEGLTRDAARALAKMFLGAGTNVIIDDTNLNSGTMHSWQDLAFETNSKVEVVTMETTLKECIWRDSKRENGVGRSVIVGMALQSGLYPRPENGVVLCDIDGTLADITHRLHFVHPYIGGPENPEAAKKDWKSFFGGIPDDRPRLEVIDMLMKHEEEGRKIFIISARPDTYREMTEAWLEKAFNGYQPYEAVLMRRASDKRPDTEVKADMLRQYFPDHSWIREIIDDRPSVIRMWREKGFYVVDVGNGIEF